MKHKARFSENGHLKNGRYSLHNHNKRILKPKTINQKLYMDAIESNDIVFCIGPAGTGKTHVAAGMAAKFFGQFNLLEPDREMRIVGVRPAREAGPSIGFLPGKEQDKIRPYMRPLLDQLSKFIPLAELRRHMCGDPARIEICALQFMRGSTFEDSIVVFDEAQNATFTEMKMFLTRLGTGTKYIINGDIRQSDLPRHEQGALADAIERLAGLEGVAVVEMSIEDAVVRHPLLPKIIERYSGTTT